MLTKRHVVIAFVVVVGLAFVAGVISGSHKKASKTKSSTTTSLAPTTTTTSDSTTTTTSPNPPVSAATASTGLTMHQDGIVNPTWYYAGYDRPQADTQLTEIKATGANWVTLSPVYFQATATSSSVAPDGHKTSTDPDVTHAINAAHERGLLVALKPHIEVSNGSGRTAIAPTDRAAWYRSYTNFIKHYADLATTTGVDELIIGSDFEKLSTDTAQWNQVIATVRAAYAKPITYAADIYEYQKIKFWDKLDAIGINAYWSLPVADPHNVDQLEVKWQPIAVQLEAVSKQWNKPILFNEAGYMSQADSTAEPANFSKAAPVDNEVQAAAYKALLATFLDKPWFAGVHWWMWDVIGKSDQSRDYTPHGKPAEAVLTSYFSRPR